MTEVFVYIYDISKGLASQLSLQILGKFVSGIWHTGIVVYGKEISFGSNGIGSCPPTGTVLGNPNDIVKLGTTIKREDEIDLFLDKLSGDIFHGSKYDLLNHNCNTFSNELSIWLTGKGIPSYVTDLPREILDTPFGQMMKPYLEQFSAIRLSVNQAEATHYDRNLNNSIDFCLIYHKECFGKNVDDFLRDDDTISQCKYKDIVKTLVLSNDSSSFLPDEIIDFLDRDFLDINLKIILFEVLRLFILRDIENVVVLFVDPVIWMQEALQKSSNDELNNVKCKFICNLVGKHFEIISSNTEVLKIIINFCLISLNCPKTLQTSSSLIRNIVINMSALDDESILEISSCLINILSENKISEDESTKTNIIGSIYYLVKTSVLVKDLAKAQDLDKRIRRETQFCQLLHNELQ